MLFTDAFLISELMLSVSWNHKVESYQNGLNSWSWEVYEWVKFIKSRTVCSGWIHEVQGCFGDLDAWSWGPSQWLEFVKLRLSQWVNLMKLRAVQYVEMKLWLFQWVGFMKLIVISVGCIPEVEVVSLYWIDEFFNGLNS
jgi:hypothetical protein